MEGKGRLYVQNRKKAKGEVTYCSICDIVLCLPCYKMVHTEEGLDNLRKTVRGYLDEDNERSTPRPMVVYTNRFWKRKMEVDGEILMETTKNRLQERRVEYFKKISALCSNCADERSESSDGGKKMTPWICDTRMG